MLKHKKEEMGIVYHGYPEDGNFSKVTLSHLLKLQVFLDQCSYHRVLGGYLQLFPIWRDKETSDHSRILNLVTTLILEDFEEKPLKCLSHWLETKERLVVSLATHDRIDAAWRYKPSFKDDLLIARATALLSQHTQGIHASVETTNQKKLVKLWYRFLFRAQLRFAMALVCILHYW